MAEMEEAEAGSLEVGDVVVLLDADGSAAWAAMRETISRPPADGDASRVVLRKEDPGSPSLSPFDGSPVSLAHARPAHLEVDAPRGPSGELPISPGRIGLRSCSAGGRYLQAARKGSRRLLLASSRLAAQETWEVHASESHGTVLRNAVLPGCELRVRIFRLGNARSGTASGADADASTAVTVHNSNEHVANYADHQPTVLHEMSNLLLEEWHKALQSEVSKRVTLSEQLQSLREESEQLKNKMSEHKTRALKMVESIDNEVLLRLASQLWVLIVRNKRKKAEKAFYQDMRRSMRASFERWMAYKQQLEHNYSIISVTRALASVRESFACWRTEGRHSHLLRKQHSKMEASANMKCLHKAMYAFQDVVLSKQAACDVLRGRYEQQMASLVGNLFKEWKERAVDLPHDAADYGKLATLRQWVRSWREGADEEMLVCAGKRKIGRSLLCNVMTGWMDHVEYMRESNDAATELEQQRQLMFMQDIFSEYKRVVRQLRDAYNATEEQVNYARVEIKRGVLYELYLFRQEHKKRESIEHYFAQMHSSKQSKHALDSWTDAHSIIQHSCMRSRAALSRCQALRSRVSFDIWLANIEEEKWEERMLRRATDRFSLLRYRQGFRALEKNADRADELRAQADSVRYRLQLRKSFGALYYNFEWQTDAEVATRKLQKTFQRLSLLRWKESAQVEADNRTRSIALRNRKLIELGFFAFAYELERDKAAVEMARNVARKLSSLKQKESLRKWQDTMLNAMDAKARAESFKDRKLLQRAFAGVEYLEDESKRGAVQLAKDLRCRSAIRSWRTVTLNAKERLCAAERMAGWREASAAARCLQGWMVQVVLKARAKEDAEAKFMRHAVAHRNMLVRESFDQWSEKTDEKIAAFDNVERVVKTKQIAKENFLRWYWDAFAPEIQNALRVLNRSMDDSLYENDKDRLYSVVTRSQKVQREEEDDFAEVDESPSRRRLFYRAFTQEDDLQAGHSDDDVVGGEHQSYSPSGRAVVRAASPARETLAYDPREASFTRFHGTEPQRQYVTSASNRECTRRPLDVSFEEYEYEDVHSEVQKQNDNATFAVSPATPDEEGAAASSSEAAAAASLATATSSRILYDFKEGDDNEDASKEGADVVGDASDVCAPA
jgi:hypothetical protein